MMPIYELPTQAITTLDVLFERSQVEPGVIVVSTDEISTNAPVILDPADEKDVL